MKTNTIKFKMLSLAALTQFFTRLIVIINRIGADKLKITSAFNDLLLPAFDKLDIAYKKAQGSVHTARITLLGNLMDEAIRGIMMSANGMSKSFVPDIAAAAKNVKYLFSGYVGLLKKPRDERCADATNIVNALKGKYAADVAKLGYGEWVEKLEAYNNELIELKDVRIIEKSEKGKNNSVVARKEIVEAYRAICKLVEVNVLIEGVSNYEDFIRNTNALIVEFVGAPATPSASTGSSDEKDDAPEEKYPNAKEWKVELNMDSWLNGDIAWIIIGGKKEYFELIDRRSIDISPDHVEWEAAWKKLD